MVVFVLVAMDVTLFGHSDNIYVSQRAKIQVSMFMNGANFANGSQPFPLTILIHVQPVHIWLPTAVLSTSLAARLLLTRLQDHHA